MKMLLDRANIPYHVRGEQLHNIYGIAGTPALGPMEFLIPEELQEKVEALLQELFDIDPELPERCPACDAATRKGQFDCPSCGLFLG